MTDPHYEPLRWIIQNRTASRPWFVTMAAFDDRDVAVEYAKACSFAKPHPTVFYSVMENDGIDLSGQTLWRQIWKDG